MMIDFQCQVLPNYALRALIPQPSLLNPVPRTLDPQICTFLAKHENPVEDTKNPSKHAKHPVCPAWEHQTAHLNEPRETLLFSSESLEMAQVG